LYIDSGSSLMAAFASTMSKDVRTPIGTTTVMNTFGGSGLIGTDICGIALQILVAMALMIMCIAVSKMGYLNPPVHCCMSHLLYNVKDSDIEYHMKAIDVTDISPCTE